MENVVSLTSKKDAEKQKSLIEALNFIIEQVKNGDVEEVIAVTLDKDGSPSLTAIVQDEVGAYGMFELGKQMLFQQMSME